MSKDFKRQNSHKHKRVPSSWRRPRGTHSPMRRKEKHRAAMPNKGFRTPEAERGVHPSGFEEVHVHRPADLEAVDAETEAVRIGGSVGGRKREAILDAADEAGIHVLNPGTGDTGEAGDET